MNLTSISDVRSLVRAIGLKPSRALGQNFLIDRNILEILLRAADLSARDRVLEIGPGLGVLTEQLLARTAGVTAIERDAALCEYLETRFGADPRWRLIAADATQADLEALLSGGITRMVSNLPYSVGSRILVDVAAAPHAPARVVVTVQDEVAGRLAAEPGTKAFGLLSVLVQRRYRVSLEKRISATCFWPRPDVRSAIVRMERTERFGLAGLPRQRFESVTRHAFAHRRKQLKTILAQAPPPLRLEAAACAEVLDRAGLDPTARPETVDVSGWCRLAEVMAERVGQG